MQMNPTPGGLGSSWWILKMESTLDFTIGLFLSVAFYSFHLIGAYTGDF